MRVVRQLSLNWEHVWQVKKKYMFGRLGSAGSCCLAALQNLLVHQVSWVGGPPLGRGNDPMAKQFLHALMGASIRQASVLSSSPSGKIMLHFTYYKRLGRGTCGRKWPWTAFNIADIPSPKVKGPPGDGFMASAK